MQSRARALVVLGAIAAALALFLVLKGNGSSDSDTTSSGATSASKPLVIQVGKDGKPVGGVAELTVSKGDDIRFTVDSAVSDEVHLHGYDIAKEVEAGGSGTFDGPAPIAGVFAAAPE